MALFSSRNHEEATVPVIDDPEMLRLYGLAESIARSTLPVLVVGETGVGKEILSTVLHTCSLRADKPLVRINGAAVPETLLESELFGFEKGAFTGAAQSKRGLIESADGGSFLFDEIGEMPLSIQAKLLRVLESGEVIRLGALRPSTIDVRFIAATNRDLPALVAAGAFRRDLYYRLNGFTLRIPPLRKRVPEIPSLARRFLSSYAKAMNREPMSLSPDAIELLRRHAWPGNVRELKNVIERAGTICHGSVVGVDSILLDAHFADTLQNDGDDEPRSSPVEAPVEIEATKGLLRTCPEADRLAIERALEATGGNQSRAAKILGVSRRTMMKWLDRHGFKRPRKG
jgi:transcriptional regulator with PAS, ATPase and Fis domain